MFAIVEFLDSSEVAVVPKGWIQNNFCRWPKKPPMSFARHVEKCKPVNKNWPLYHVRVLKDFMTYAGARGKLSDAAEMSDLSDAGKVNSKRIHKTRVERPPETSESEEDDRNVIKMKHSALPLPPPCLVSALPLVPPPPLVQHQLFPFRNSSLPSESNEEEYAMNGTAPQFGMNEMPDDFLNYASEVTAERSTQTDDKQWESTTGEEKEFQKLVLSTLALLKKDVDTIMVLLSSQQLAEPRIADPIAGLGAAIPCIPCTTREAMNLLEAELLTSEELKTNITELLALTGGRNVREAFSRILEKIMTEQVGSQYSLKGKKGKAAFNQLVVLNECILDAARKMMKIPITEAMRDENLSAILVNTGDKVKKCLKRKATEESPEEVVEDESHR